MAITPDDLRSLVIKDTAHLYWTADDGVNCTLSYKTSDSETWNTVTVRYTRYEAGGIFSYPLSNLTPDTTYNWTATQGSYTSAQNTFVIPPALATPSNLSATTTASSATISWGAVTNADYYNVSYKKTSETDYTTFTTGKTSIVLTGLEEDVTYDWNVVALDKEQEYCDSAAGSSTFTPETPSTAPLSAPTGLTHDQVTSNSARVGWNAVTNAVDYKVEYRVQGATNWTEDQE